MNCYACACIDDSSRPSLAARLDDEWTTIRARPNLVALARTWRVTTRPFDDLDELLILAGYRVEDTPERNDVLVRLIETARTDELAPGTARVAQNIREESNRTCSCSGCWRCGCWGDWA